MIARLNNEKVVREELEKQRKDLLAKKQALISENKKRKDDLASLDEQLKKFSKCPPPQCSALHTILTLQSTNGAVEVRIKHHRPPPPSLPPTS